MTLEQIEKALQGHRLEVVAAETGLHYNTVRKYAEGRAVNPPAATMAKLEAFIKARRAA